LTTSLALTADWLTTFGGAEHVVAELHALWPEAPIFTAVAAPGRIGPLADADIRPTRLQRWYQLLGNHQVLLPWMPAAMESIDLSGYDVILSSSHAVGKGIIPPAGAVHVCYCHTPMRYAWEMQEQYLRDFGVPALLRPLVRHELRRLRRWDLTTAKRVDRFIANSSTTAERLSRIYGREAAVIPPPVADRYFATPLRTSPPQDDGYYLAMGRFVPYKRFDLLIAAANELQFPLWIAGAGKDESRLRSLAGPTVRFLGYVSDGDLPALVAGAEGFLFPQLEDAGLVLLEAMACGTPAIAYCEGGSRDAVIPGETGVFLQAQTVESFAAAWSAFKATTFDRAAIRRFAGRFSRAHFTAAIAAEIAQARGQKL
jgi:glycosyltransferase involved in cell wall biosynthesis